MQDVMVVQNVCATVAGSHIYSGSQKIVLVEKYSAKPERSIENNKMLPIKTPL